MGTETDSFDRPDCAEDFESVAAFLALAKETSEAGRLEALKSHPYFSDELCWDSCFQNVIAAKHSAFSASKERCGEEEGCRETAFWDPEMSKYFARARRLGRKKKLRRAGNPLLNEALAEADRRLATGHCAAWKLGAAQGRRRPLYASALTVLQDDEGCGACDIETRTAFGLVRLRKWFMERNAEPGRQEKETGKRKTGNAKRRGKGERRSGRDDTENQAGRQRRRRGNGKRNQDVQGNFA